MWKHGKRLFSLLLALAMLYSLLPMTPAQATAQPTATPTEAAYAEVDAIFDLIDAAEAAPAKKDAPQDEKTEAAIQLVMASDSYVDGSLERSGAVFTWWTDGGIRCVYNPRMRELRKDIEQDGCKSYHIDRLEAESLSQAKESEDKKDYIDDRICYSYRYAETVLDDGTESGESSAGQSVRDDEGCPGHTEYHRTDCHQQVIHK